MNTSTRKYWVHYDKDNQQYWVGVVVRYPDGAPAFVQQVGNYYQRKGMAQRHADQLELEAKSNDN